MDNFKNTIWFAFILILIIMSIPQNMFAENNNEDNQLPRHLPILRTTPNTKESVLSDTPIEIYFDENHKNYKIVQDYLDNEAFDVFVNEEKVGSYFDKENKKIVLVEYNLEPYHIYNIKLKMKLLMEGGNSNLINDSYSFDFCTVQEEYEYMAAVIDDYGNVYKVLGYSEAVKNVKIHSADINVSEIMDFTKRYPISSPNCIKIDLPEDLGYYVRIMTDFGDEPERLLRLREEEKVAEWKPYSYDEDTKETAFNVREDGLFIPIKYVDITRVMSGFYDLLQKLIG